MFISAREQSSSRVILLISMLHQRQLPLNLTFSISTLDCSSAFLAQSPDPSTLLCALHDLDHS